MAGQITSQRHASFFDIAIRGWHLSALLAESEVRMHKLAALEQAAVVPVPGKLEELDLKQVEKELARALGSAR